jgi:formylglycine-generating enzyme required for sulfatase activity
VDVDAFHLDQKQFGYPYQPADGRESIQRTRARRVLRGGSWNFSRDDARAAFRYGSHPGDRYNGLGFRVVCVVRPPLQLPPG